MNVLRRINIMNTIFSFLNILPTTALIHKREYTLRGAWLDRNRQRQQTCIPLEIFFAGGKGKEER